MGKILDLLFPPCCVQCGASGSYACKRCRAGIVMLEKQICLKCRRQNSSGRFCNQVCQQDFWFDELIAGVDYKTNLLVKKLTFAFKYKFSMEVGLILSGIMQNSASRFDFANKVVIPVPLHKSRMKFRGFNQSAFLGRAVGKLWGLELWDCLSRKAKVREQASLNREERLKNLRGIFEMKDGFDLQGRQVLLVDDVVTTGTTLNECSRILKKAGAGRISALVLARN